MPPKTKRHSSQPTRKQPHRAGITRSPAVPEDQVSDNFEVDPTYGSRRRLPSVCTSSSLPTCVREGLEQIDDHPRCCLVTLDYKDYAAIQVAHIIPRSTKAHEAATLRKAWASASYLSVDAVDNLIYLRSDIHVNFDKGYWALFPQDDLIRAVVDAQKFNDTQRSSFSDDRQPKQDLYAKFATWNEQKTFEYSLIWIGPPGSALGSPILRKHISLETKHPGTDSSTHPDQVPHAPHELFDVQQQVKLITNTLGEMMHALSGHPQEGSESGPYDEVFRKKCVSLKDSVDKLLDTHPSPNDNSQWNIVLGVLRDSSISLGAICDDLYVKLSGSGTHPHASNANQDVTNVNSGGARGTQSLQRTLASLTGLIRDYDVYLPPFSDFPVLKSHVHPIFALENAGRKLHHFSEEFLAALDPRARRIAFLYRKWHRHNPKAASTTSDGPQDDGSGHDEASHCTTEDDNATGDEPPSSQGSHASEPPSGQAIEGKSKSKQVADPIASIGTPSLSLDERSTVMDEPLDDWAHHYDSLSDWAAACCVDPDIEVTNDRQLRKDSEKPKRIRPQEWERWAKCPPKLPEVIMPEHDTSQLTSYHWALYHQNINLVAPYGSHKVPESHCIPWEVYASRDCDCP